MPCWFAAVAATRSRLSLRISKERSGTPGFAPPLLPAEVAQSQEDPGRRPRAQHDQALDVVRQPAAADERPAYPVDHVAQRQYTGRGVEHRGQVLALVERARDEDQGQEDGVHVRGRGVEVRDRLRE